MKILHTADWHIGQLFYEYDRSFEHQQFLKWLVGILTTEAVDVLLISGDIFDLSNPSAASIKMLYTFLNEATKANTNLRIILTAGNHDSAYRLESPIPLLESSNIHIVGFVEKQPDGSLDYSKLIIPLKDLQSNINCVCLAVPFLRTGDYPVNENYVNPYSEGVESFYRELYNQALLQYPDCKVFIALGHLHTVGAEITDLDKSERLIMGGVECISANSFPEELKYVALGHIHKAQKIGGKEHVRYSGSPIPMSFSELNYKHQVVVFDIIGDSIQNITNVEVPLVVSLLRVPLTNKPLPEVIAELDTLPAGADVNSPYLEVKVLLNGPEPSLRNRIETALNGKNVRLAKIDVKYPLSNSNITSEELISQDKLSELKPLDVFTKTFVSKYNSEAPEKLIQLFNEISNEVNLLEE